MDFDDDDIDWEAVEAEALAQKAAESMAAAGAANSSAPALPAAAAAAAEPAAQPPPAQLPPQPPQTSLGDDGLSSKPWVSVMSEDEKRRVDQSLMQLYGYEFRDGQREVVEAALAGKDVAVFWATGRGKSICYQLPALHTGRTAIVVSPLISLMTDQVERLNNTVGQGRRQVAAFLGSAQRDPTVERRAFDGEFPLVFMSPEKLSADGVGRLAQMHARTPLLLFAIDEAHCVSEWGHDFRPDYRRLGELRASMPDVPIMALTATAVPDVQRDIVRSLGLRSPYVQKQSSYRPNLTIRVSRKLSGLSESLDGLVKTLLANNGAAAASSTLVYVASENDAEGVAAFLRSRHIVADFYHAGRTPADRERVHLTFLSGQLPVVCATVAFGMGIDKPDIRRVVHYGAPKTAEEYYQHIGRAGRDGGPATCEMIANDNDFSKYASDFYTKQLPTGGAKERVLASTERLRGYANNTTACRWVALLGLMGERADFNACGACDCCVRKKQFEGDSERNYAGEARLLLTAAQANGVISRMEKAMAAPPLAAMKAELKPKRSWQTLKDFMPILVNAGLLSRTQQKNPQGYGAYDVYRVTPKGQQQLRELSRVPMPPLLLQVPDAVRREDKIEQEKAARTRVEVSKALQKLQAAGIDVGMVPEAELEPGAEKTPVTSAILHWTRALEDWRSRGQAGRADAHEALFRSVQQWRVSEAARLRMAPASVLADHLVMKICQIKPTESESLLALGARITADGARALIGLLDGWRAQHGTFIGGASSQGAAASQGASTAASQGSQGSGGGQGGQGGQAGGSQGGGSPMKLPAGTYTPARPWSLAVPPAGKKAPAWEMSWRRFQEGKKESVEMIALTQESGKAIQPSTVTGHLLAALVQGRPVDLQRLAQQCERQGLAPPSEDEWEKLESAEAASGLDVVKTEKLSTTDVLKVFVPGAEKPFAERDDAEKAELNRWFGKLSWYTSFRKVGLVPSFEGGAAKQARMA